MENSDVAQMLTEIADILDLTNANTYRVRAYRQAAQLVDTLPGPISEIWRKGELTNLPSIGTRIAELIGQILETGSCGEHDKLVSGIPGGVLELLKVEGVGPKTVAAVWKTLQVTSLDALEQCCRDGRLAELPRMGPLRAKAILSAIERYRARLGRTPLHRALAVAESILARLRQVPGVQRVEVAGSVRRRRETVADLDILVSSPDPGPPATAFRYLAEVDQVLAEGPTKSSARLRSGLQVDLRVLPPESFGAAMHYFTGSKAHNIALRTRAVRLGIKISEYGVFDREGHRLGGEREEDVFRAVGLPWIPPELREGAGELEAAEAGALPALLEEGDLLGDLHVHTKASSDARATLEELWEEGRRLGRQYLAITDHSKSRPLGLDAAKVLEQAARIRALNARLGAPPRLLAGIEVDILQDGSLDLPEEVLAQLDWVVASLHSHFRDPPEQITARMIRAMRSGVVDCLGHPSGRIIGMRDPYAFDLARVLEVARQEGVALEVNAQPERLDLTDKACRLAKEAGVRLALSTDAHVTSHLGNMRHGVWVARRGWLTRAEVVNCEREPRRRPARGGGMHAEAH